MSNFVVVGLSAKPGIDIIPLLHTYFLPLDFHALGNFPVREGLRAATLAKRTVLYPVHLEEEVHAIQLAGGIVIRVYAPGKETGTDALAPFDVTGFRDGRPVFGVTVPKEVEGGRIVEESLFDGVIDYRAAFEDTLDGQFTTLFRLHDIIAPAEGFIAGAFMGVDMGSPAGDFTSVQGNDNAA